MSDQTDILRIEYVPLPQAVLWDKNPKLHDKPKIKGSIQRHGFKDPPKFEPALNEGRGGLAEGNGRTTCLAELRDSGAPVPRGIVVLEDGEWAIPIIFGVDSDSEAAAEAYAIDHNNITLGPGFDHFDATMLWDDDYLNVLSDLSELPISVDGGELSEMLEHLTLMDEEPAPTRKVVPDNEGAFKVTLTLRLPPTTYQLYQSLTRDMDKGLAEDEKFLALLKQIDGVEDDSISG